jgi:DNA topoisomerase-1
VTEVLPEGSKDKPRTASLFSSMSLDTVTLDDARELLSLPRTLVPPDGDEIVVSNGRYGPYVKQGDETRSLESEDLLLTITTEQALAVLAQPKQRRGRGARKPPLKELGPDPTTGKALVVKDGRFGPYVTDGKTNASLRRGDSPETLTIERAVELLAERRAKTGS